MLFKRPSVRTHRNTHATTCKDWTHLNSGGSYEKLYRLFLPACLRLGTHRVSVFTSTELNGVFKRKKRVGFVFSPFTSAL